MDIIIKRIALRNTYTIGKLYIDGKYFCDTLEDKVRDINKNGIFDNGEEKIMHQTAIPYGRYKTIYTYSPKFARKLPLLLDVPLFTGIRIHAGNNSGHTSGCILVGKNSVVGGLTDSKKTLDELLKYFERTEVRGENVYVIIK